MSVRSFLSTVHLNGETNLETKAFSTPKLKKLKSPKSRLKQALLGSITKPNFMQIRWTVMEKWMFSHTFELVAVTSFTHCYLSALITPHWKVLWN